MYLYLAGRMTGLPAFNHPAFHAAAADLRSRGHVIENPAEVLGGDVAQPYATYMRIHIPTLLRVEGICLLDDWEQSTGARLEARISRALGLKAYLYTPARPDGIRSVNLTLEVLPA